MLQKVKSVNHASTCGYSSPTFVYVDRSGRVLLHTLIYNISISPKFVKNLIFCCGDVNSRILTCILNIMSILSSESGKINRIIFGYEKPKTYLNLIQKVGTEGKYQKQMVIVFSLNWFITGVILLSNIFLFRNRLYDCQQKGLLLSEQHCLDYICSLPEEEWSQYFAPGHNDFKNIATLNNYECEDSLPSIIASACTYIGAALGFLVVTFLADNYGRKLSLLISWGICTVGCLVVVFDSNIYLVALGLFLSGFGSDASNNITFLFFCETLNNSKRQKYSIIVQIFFTLGALVGTTCFYLINDWRIVWSILVVFPALIYFFLLFCYVE